ncbi:hypothetical protein M2284_004787 [Rhodococcus sp. LBL1]|uniref:Uncharacterized protein n=1 Tax=Prescottella agglutinans TaxID=1644129 RepID=A0ABT6MB95_9NOCA|nr:hypothetical protein [Prescottella agglutinans]MDH6281573.1 hypothetical protein [Prescottella agglutinans]MDH6680558.1 hypothetical protein [Rhodococcus sp. LBL1]MDH6686121.1 hypothetical protein [Rhodococcus sp. LBL2]
MAVVLTYRAPLARGSVFVDAWRRFWARRNLTPQERANLAASYTPTAVVTASLGGHLRAA